MSRYTSLWVASALLVAAVAAGIGRFITRPAYAAADVSQPHAPVLVELFTSEGCSSCPPADALLAQIAKRQRDVIVLSEHVTYWNDIGWQDPYSSPESTARQAAYVDRLRLSSSYTPQMVVNGHEQFAGSDARSASQAIERATADRQVPININHVEVAADHRVHLDITTGAVAKDATLLLILTQDEGSQKVENGENGGRVLHHVQIARSFRRLALVRSGEPYQSSPTLALPQAIAGSGWHVVALLQQGDGGPVVGSASQEVREP